jgi:ABC-2 type transport system permease protein
MSAASVSTASPPAARLPLQDRAAPSFLAVLVAESKAEVLKAVRLPMFLVPVLTFPAMFYVLFGVLMSGGRQAGGVDMSAYLLATYGAFGVIGAALFGMGVGVAIERGQGWFTLKQATPMPPLAYFLAKVVMSAAIGICVVVLLSILAFFVGDVRLPALTWLGLLAVLAAGAVPFCAMGCAIGFTAGPNSAPIIANLVYLPMSVASGLWIPFEHLPPLLRSIAPWLPPYHLARLALGVLGDLDGVAAVTHTAVLAVFSGVFLAIAVLAYRHGTERTWG